MCSPRILTSVFILFGVFTTAVDGVEESWPALEGAPEEIEAFERFVTSFGKRYEAAEERARRFGVFQESLRKIEESNAVPGRSYQLGVTKFADVTPEEFRKSHLSGFDSGRSRLPFANAKHLGTYRATGQETPQAWDWRTKGAVTPVKNQKTCGSCWAFSSTGALEGAWQRATGKLVSFSEQQLVDCSWSFLGDHGCLGGKQEHAFDYYEKHGICTEDSYPYLGKFEIMQKCVAQNCTEGIPKGSFTGYKDVEGSEEAVREALASVGPLAIAIEADQDVFRLYKSGVINDEGCGEQLDHAVLLVGYGVQPPANATASAQNYWIVKNSWGADWGEQGFVRLERGKDECGMVQMAPLYPVVSPPNATTTTTSESETMLVV